MYTFIQYVGVRRSTQDRRVTREKKKKNGKMNMTNENIKSEWSRQKKVQFNSNEADL